jgi:hypothetical protein
MFRPGVPYTRSDIKAQVGGELQTYLPQKDHCILAGCFSLELNPAAPEKVYAGNAAKVVAKAELLSRQPENSFPVFLKEKLSSKHYFFVGNYKCRDISNSPADIAAAEKESQRPGKLSYVIYLDAA